MLDFDIKIASLQELLKKTGACIESDIKSQKMTKLEVAQKAGITEMSLYRLIKGENSNLMTLYRVLRVINRTDIIEALITPVQNPLADLQTPIRLRSLARKNKKELLSEAQKKITFDDIFKQ